MTPKDAIAEIREALRSGLPPPAIVGRIAAILDDVAEP